MKRWLPASLVLCLPLLACNSPAPGSQAAHQGGNIASVAASGHSVGDFIDSVQLSDGRIVAIFGNESTAALTVAIESSNGSRSFDSAFELKPAGSNVGLYNGIARGANDSLHIITHDSTRNAILYYKGDAAGFAEAEIIAQAPSGIRAKFGIWGSIAAAANGEPHVSYYDASVAKMFYAHRSSQGWQSSLVAPPLQNESSKQSWLRTDYGRHSRIRVGSDGKVWIACYNATDGDLWLFNGMAASPSPAEIAWQLAAVDTAGDVGSWLDLELDKTGSPVTSYYDATNGDLKLARPLQKDAEGRIKVLDSEGNTGLDSSLALDSSGIAHVAYLDGSRLNLTYTREDGAPERLDKNGVNGFFPALTLRDTDYTILYHLVTRRDSQSREVTEQKLLIWPPSSVPAS